MTGAELIAAERQRQVEVEGWTPEHDAEHMPTTLLTAALCYANHAGLDLGMDGHETGQPPVSPYLWPWERSWWKPSDDPIRTLVKAGALIAAEIDRLLTTSEDV